MAYQDAYVDENGNPIDPNVTMGSLVQPSSAAPLTNLSVPTQANLPPPINAPAPVVQANGQITPTAASGSFRGNLQDLWNQYRHANPNFRPSQGSATSLQPFVDWARSQGANISIAAPSSGGYVKGITDPSGQFIKLLDGSNNPIWLPGGDAASAPATPIGDFGSLLQPFSGTAPPALNLSSFSYPDWTMPTGEEALKADPGYSFRVGQGEQALRQDAAARGLGASSGTFKSLLDYGQKSASQEYNNYVNQSLTNYLTNRSNQFGNLTFNNNAQQSNVQDAYQRYLDQYAQFRNRQLDTFNYLDTTAARGASTI